MAKCVGIYVKLTPPPEEREWAWRTIPLEERENSSFNPITWGIQQKFIPSLEGQSQFGRKLNKFVHDREQQAKLYSDYDISPIKTWTYHLTQPIKITGQEVHDAIKEEKNYIATVSEHREPWEIMEEAMNRTEIQEWLNSGKT